MSKHHRLKDDFIIFFKKISPEIKYILLFFLGSRIILEIIGVSVRIFAGSFHGDGMQSHTGNLLLDVWGAWDTGYYMYLAKNWYPALDLFSDISARTSYAFFPLYPFLMRVLGGILDNNFYLAGLIISNSSLIVASIFLYKLVALEMDKNTALRSVKYLFLFPTAFIFSGVFTESLFVALAIICFYYAKKEKWLLAGLAGFFLALTKVLGVFIIIPLLYEYLAKKRFKFSVIKKDIFLLLLIPCGLILYSLYCYYKTNDYFMFVSVQALGWGRHLSNPLVVLFDGVCSNIFYVVFGAIFTILAIVLLLVFTNRLKFSYWFFGMYSIFLPILAATAEHMPAMLRYALIIFPFYFLFADLGKNPLIDKFLTVFLIISQIVLMGLWAAGFPVML